MNKNSTLSLCTIAFLLFFCILEPHEVVQEIGICYRGNDEYRRILQNEKLIELVDTLPDTLMMDTLVKEIDLEFVVQVDTSFFKYGSYEIEIQNSPVVKRELMDSIELSVYYDYYRFGDIQITYTPETYTVQNTSDTFTVNIAYSIDADNYAYLSYDPFYQTLDTVEFAIEIYCKRYVSEKKTQWVYEDSLWQIDADYCSSNLIFTSDSIVAIVRRPNE